jgi:crotonobetaine/carnitine-CoA ligase
MEVENEINSHPAVLECAVIPVEASESEQEVRAIIVLKEGKTLDHEEFIHFIEPRMAYFMVPRYIDLIDALPKTPTGKIQKFLLKERAINNSTWDREAAGIKLTK